MPGRQIARTKAKGSKEGSGDWAAGLPVRASLLALYVKRQRKMYGIERHDWLSRWTLSPMILEPFGDLSDAKIIVAYREEPQKCGGRLYQVPQLVVLEYPNGFIRLVRESEIDAVFAGLKAEIDEHEEPS